MLQERVKEKNVSNRAKLHNWWANLKFPIFRRTSHQTLFYIYFIFWEGEEEIKEEVPMTVLKLHPMTMPVIWE